MSSPHTDIDAARVSVTSGGLTLTSIGARFRAPRVCGGHPAIYVHGKEDPMTKVKRFGALLFAVFTLAAAVAPAALGDAPGPGDKPQCAGGPSNNNPHCPQNK